MSPPTVVLHREFVSIPKNCPTIELIQNECDYDHFTQKFTCIPLVRTYRVCDTPQGKQHYEITHLVGGSVVNATKEMLAIASAKNNY